MLATPHMLAGAAIGKLLRRPNLAWPVAFASHFVLDIVPHLDSHRLFGHPTGGLTRAEVAMAAVDTLVGIALVCWVAWGQSDRRLLLFAAFFGLLPDFLDNIPWFGMWYRTWPVTAWFFHFHHAVQHNVRPSQWPLGFGTQAVVSALALWVCWPRRPGPQPTED